MSIEVKSNFSQHLPNMKIINIGHTNIGDFLADAFKHFKAECEKATPHHDSLETILNLLTKFTETTNTNDDEIPRKKDKKEWAIKAIIDRYTDYEQIWDEIVQKFNTLLNNDPSLKLISVDYLRIKSETYSCDKGSYLPLPTELKTKDSIINIRNADEESFKWAILSAIYRTENDSQCVSKLEKYQNHLNFDGINFPIQLHDLDKFEELNPNISINVYYFNDYMKKIEIVRLAKDERSNHIQLLLLRRVIGIDRQEINDHYCWIVDFNRLLGSNESKAEYCNRCLNHFQSQLELDQHKNECKDKNSCRIEMPTEDKKKIQFENFQKQRLAPYIIYADIETLIHEPKSPFKKNDKTKVLQEHTAMSVGYFLQCAFYDSKSKYQFNRGPNCIDWFIQQLKDLAIAVSPIFDEINNESTASQPKVPKIIPIIFHNMSNYDAHFIVGKLNSQIDGYSTVLPSDGEKYLTFSKSVRNSGPFGNEVKLQFIDSYNFMAESLASLSALLPLDRKSNLTSELAKEYANKSQEQLQLLQHKGHLPYEYLDSFEKMNETLLPPPEKFYSQLRQEGISDEDYAHAQNVWKVFDCVTLGDYVDIYLRNDVLLLADVFQNFRENCLKMYGLDPAYYVTGSGFSWDAMLKYTGVKLELLTDIDQLMFVERGVRGGMAQCSKRYIEANNKYMGDKYAPNKQTSYLVYFDCNNLYGFSMMQPLPLDGFKWTDKTTFDTSKILSHPDDSPIGYFFEVDLKYPKNLHEAHDDYPFCAEQRSPLDNDAPKNEQQKLLLLTLYDKKNYIIHYKMLKLALQQGLLLEKIHRVLQFNQSKWLEPYITFNTQKRMQATNDFEKNLYKRLNNCIYGKTMENIRKWSNPLKIPTTFDGKHGITALTSNPNFLQQHNYDDGFVTIESKKSQLFMNKPISIGVAILDISKTIMYNFHYNFIKQKYGANAKLAYTDTDSFLYEIKTECIYSDIKNHLDKFDTSDYPETNQFGIRLVNKKVPGKFKDEMKSEIISKFVCLRAKVYCIQGCAGRIIKRAAGISKNVRDKEIHFDDYRNSLFNNRKIVRKQCLFQNSNHKMFTVEQEKSIDPSYNKRFIKDDGINSISWGNESELQTRLRIKMTEFALCVYCEQSTNQQITI